MKKIITTLALLLTLSFTGCSNDEEEINICFTKEYIGERYYSVTDTTIIYTYKYIFYNNGVYVKEKIVNSYSYNGDGLNNMICRGDIPDNQYAEITWNYFWKK